jgi:hypothetical protein
MSTTSKLVVSRILVILVVALSTYNIIQANGQGFPLEYFNPHNQKLEQICKHCKELKATMAEDELANSAQWKSMHCESLLK